MLKEAEFIETENRLRKVQMVHFLTQEKLTEMTVILNPKQQELRDLTEEFKRKMDLMEKFDSDTLILADDKQKLQQTLKKVN